MLACKICNEQVDTLRDLRTHFLEFHFTNANADYVRRHNETSDEELEQAGIISGMIVLLADFEAPPVPQSQPVAPVIERPDDNPQGYQLADIGAQSFYPRSSDVAGPQVTSDDTGSDSAPGIGGQQQ